MSAAAVAVPVPVSDEALDHSRLALATALGLIGLPSLAFLGGQILLLAGGHIAPASATAILLLASGLSLAMAWAVSSWRAAAAVAGVALIALLLNGLIYDTSYDGQNYHAYAVTALAEGWNPFHDPGPGLEVIRRLGPPDLWVQHYPQGAWIGSALQVAAGLPPESAKNHGVLILLATLLAAYGAGLRLGLGRLAAAGVAAAAAASPVLIGQLFTRLNDGLLGALLAIFIIFAALWIWSPRWWAAAGALLALVLALNLKFSAVPMAVGLCGLLCAWALWLQGWKGAGRTAAALALAGVIGVLVAGAHPYATNTLRQGHPFYPLMGEGKVDIMEHNRPFSFRTISPAQRLVASYFGATANGYYPKDERLKPPFMIYPSELRHSGGFDPRIGGFGPLFSGALVLAVVLAAGAMLHKPRRRAVTPLIVGAGGVVLLAIAMPESWWARYAPQVWWAVALVAAAGLISKPRASRVGAWALVGVLLLNAGLVAASSTLHIGERNLAVRRQIQEIAASPQPVCLFLGHGRSRLDLLGEARSKVRLLPQAPTGCPLVPLAATYTNEGTPGYCPCP